MIESIEATNFMSYDHFNIQLEEGINLLVGEKGSGKTSILEAIRLAFGGLGRERQDLLADFIKKGKKSSSVRLKLSNTVSTFDQTKILPSLPKESTIVLERELHRNRASKYKINGERTRKYKLVDILSKIGVSPENKLFFLPQEKVNEWVNVGRKKRLEMYLRALGLLELKTKIDRLKDKIREKKKEREKYLEIVNKWEKRAEEKKENILEPEVAKETLERYYTFKIAKLIHEKHQVEQKIERKKKNRERTQKKINKLEQETENIEKERKELEKKRKKTSERWHQLMVDKKPKFSDKKNKLERRIQEKQAKLETLRNQYKEKFEQIQKKREKWSINNIEGIEKLIDERKKEIERIEEKLLMESAYKKIQDLEKELTELKYDKNDLKEKLENHRGNLNNLLQELEAPSIEKIYPKLLDKKLIGVGNTQKRQVFGPIGLELEIDMPISEAKDYCSAIESGLGQLFYCFLALNRTQYEKIKQISTEIKKGHKIKVYSLSFDDSEISFQKLIHKKKNQRVKLKKECEEKLGIYKGSIAAWLPEIIEGPPPVMALIETLFWNVPITTDISIGKEIVRRLNISKVLALNGEIIKKVPTSEKIEISFLSPPFHSYEESVLKTAIGFSISDFLKREEKIKQELEKLYHKIEKKKNSIDKAKQNLPLTIQKLLEKQAELEEEITELKQDESKLERLRNQREREIEEEETIKKEIKEMRINIDDIADKVSEVEEEIDALREKEKEIVEKKKELKEVRETKLSKLERLKGKNEDLPLVLNMLEKEKKTKEKQISEAKKETLGFMKMMRRFDIYGEELEKLLEERILKPMRKIQKMDIKTINEGLNRLREYSRDYRQAIRETEEKMEEVEKMMEKAKKYRKKIAEVEEEKEEIKKLSNEETRQLLKQIKRKTEVIDHNYKHILSYLGAKGEIAVKGKNIEELLLKTTIDLHRNRPVDVSKGGFSSGEKTIAIMSMIIAILLTSPAPVYIWDEFEVFLDNRSLQNFVTIIVNALDTHQGILTTTHREKLIKAADKVFFTEYDREERRSKVIPLMDTTINGGIQKEEKFGQKWISS